MEYKITEEKSKLSIKVEKLEGKQGKILEALRHA